MNGEERMLSFGERLTGVSLHYIRYVHDLPWLYLYDGHRGFCGFLFLLCQLGIPPSAHWALPLTTSDVQVDTNRRHSDIGALEVLKH